MLTYIKVGSIAFTKNAHTYLVAIQTQLYQSVFTGIITASIFMVFL